MRKKMETSERDQTSRASFKCLNCEKKFTDLEANQLLDFTTGEMRYVLLHFDLKQNEL